MFRGTLIFVIGWVVISCCAILYAAPALRLVSLKPNITDILIGLGVGKDIVGITTYCDWPYKMRVARVADYTSVNLEKVISLKPSLVFASRENASEREIASLQRVGLRVLLVSFDSLASTFNSIMIIGSSIGYNEEARRMVWEIKSRISQLKQPTRRKRVLVVLGYRPVVVATKGTLIGEIVEVSGGANVVENALVQYPRFSSEMLLSTKPDVVVDLSTSFGRGGRTFLESLFAGVGGKGVPVYHLDVADFRAGPNMVNGLEALNEILAR